MFETNKCDAKEWRRQFLHRIIEESEERNKGIKEWTSCVFVCGVYSVTNLATELDSIHIEDWLVTITKPKDPCFKLSTLNLHNSARNVTLQCYFLPPLPTTN